MNSQHKWINSKRVIVLLIVVFVLHSTIVLADSSVVELSLVINDLSLSSREKSSLQESILSAVEKDEINLNEVIKKIKNLEGKNKSLKEIQNMILPEKKNNVPESELEIIDEFNVGNLRVDADFRVPISELIDLDNEMYWVPAVSLGEPGTPVRDLLKLKGKPEELRDEIDTLYEASAYVQASGMNSYSGNRYVEHEGLIWQISAHPEFVLSANEANCLSMANTVAYLLNDDYEEVGFVVWGADMGGHIYNYIKKDGTYYVFDLRIFAINKIKDSRYPGIEDGTTGEYFNGDKNGFVYEIPEDDNGSPDFSGLVEFVRRSTDINFMILFPAPAFEMTGSTKQDHSKLYVRPDFPMEKIIKLYNRGEGPWIFKAESSPEWIEGLY